MGSSQSKVVGNKLYESYLQDATKLNDLSGKVVAVTGTSPGSIGYFIAETAAKKNAKCILLLNRRSERSAAAEKGIQTICGEGTTVQTVPIDLLSFDSVEKAAVEINAIAKENGGLDVLACNAGIMAMDDDRTVDGFNVEIQACHLSHALLTKKCMASLELASKTNGEARVVYQSSSARFGIKLEAKYYEKCDPGTLGGNGMRAWRRYHMAKLGNASFAMALHDALRKSKSNVKSIGCDPGYATSNLQTTSQNTGYMITFILNNLYYIGGAQSPADGSLTASVACFGPGVDSGDFFAPKGRLNLAGEPAKTISQGKPVQSGKEKETTDDQNKATIMDATVKALGLSSFL